MSAKERKDLNNVQRSERSAIEFAEGQSTVAEVAESFLRNLETEYDDFHDAFIKGVVYCCIDGVSAKGRTVEELITVWNEAQDKRRQDFDVLDEIASQYRGSDLEDWIRQGNIVKQQRADDVFYKFADLAERVRNNREREIREAEQLMKQRQESPDVSDKGVEVLEERGFFSEPYKDPGFSRLLLNLSGDAEQAEDKYRRMDMVVDSGAFVSGMPPECFPEYPVDEVDEGQAEG